MNVGSVAISPHEMIISAKKDFCNAVENRFACSGGEGRNQFDIKPFEDSAKLQIRRTEGVAPFRDAVSLVNGDVGDFDLREPLQEFFPAQNFGICDDYSGGIFAVRKGSEILFPLFCALAALKDHTADARLFHAAFLVAHEGKQGINDESGSL